MLKPVPFHHPAVELPQFLTCEFISVDLRGASNITACFAPLWHNQAPLRYPHICMALNKRKRAVHAHTCTHTSPETVIHGHPLSHRKMLLHSPHHSLRSKANCIQVPTCHWSQGKEDYHTEKQLYPT